VRRFLVLLEAADQISREGGRADRVGLADVLACREDSGIASLEMRVDAGVLIVDGRREQPGAAEHRVRTLHRRHRAEVVGHAVDIRVESGSRHWPRALLA
jgi:hypothetical protein